MSKKSDSIRYEVITQEDPDTGDLILPLPKELLDKMGWKIGDELEWLQEANGSWVIKLRKAAP